MTVTACGFCEGGKVYEHQTTFTRTTREEVDSLIKGRTETCPHCNGSGFANR